jgi:hypothetical protein
MVAGLHHPPRNLYKSKEESVGQHAGIPFSHTALVNVFRDNTAVLHAAGSPDWPKRVVEFPRLPRK